MFQILEHLRYVLFQKALSGSFICSLMVNMLNAPKEVRAASLRVMKHLIVDEESLELFLDLHLDYIVARLVFFALKALHNYHIYPR